MGIYAPITSHEILSALIILQKNKKDDVILVKFYTIS